MSPKTVMSPKIMCPLLLALIVSPLVVGCTGEAERAVARRKSNLKQLSLGYRAYFTDLGTTPSGAAALAEYLQGEHPGDEAVDNAITAASDGDVVLIWNSELAEGTDLTEYVVAFEAMVPGSGGYLATGDGEVKLVTARQFGELTLVPEPPR